MICPTTTEHSSTGIKPNDFTAEDEIKYIDKMNELTNTIKERDGFRLKPGTKVRIINDTSTIGKKRSNLSKDYYQIVSADGNAYLIQGSWMNQLQAILDIDWFQVQKVCLLKH